MDNEKKDLLKTISSWVLPIILLIMLVMLVLKAVDLKRQNDEYAYQIENYENEINSLREQLEQNNQE